MLLKDRIKGFKIFAGLSNEELGKIIPLCQICNFNEGDIVIKEDTIGSALYVILEGRLNVEIGIGFPQTFRSSNSHLAIRREGDILGAMSFLRRDRTILRLTALDRVAIIKIDGHDLLELFEKDHHLGYSIMKNIALILDERLVNLCFKLRNNEYSAPIDCVSEDPFES